MQAPLSPLPIPDLIYRSHAMHTVAQQIQRAAQHKIPVIITGESGTGKERVASAIHRLSARAARPYITVNCATVMPTLAESTLFGHVAGAFTGAHRDAPGLIRSADKGTLLLDEIGELPLVLQPKLLRFLQEGEIQVVGESRVRRVDVRVIAATNQDLQALLKQGSFREDLYYRLQGFEIVVPPLRERRDDIPLLASHFVQIYARADQKKRLRISPAFLEALLRYDWPGNVRELQSEIQKAVAFAGSGEELDLQHLSAHLRPALPELDRVMTRFGRSRSSAATPSPPLMKLDFPREASLPEIWGQMERAFFLEALQRHGWNLSHTAKALGKSLPYLRKKMKQHGLRTSPERTDFPS